MACNCGSRANRRRGFDQGPVGVASGDDSQWTLKMRSGEVFSFGSRLEADAENARRGYQGIVRKV